MSAPRSTRTRPPKPTVTRGRALLGRWSLLSQLRVLPRTTRLMLFTQLAFNIGFYLVVPYLAVHLADNLALAGWAIGMVLGVRTFSQQGLFFLGGALADRYGTKPVVLAGCAVRITGFLVLAFASSLTGVLVGTVLTGMAGALFSPAVEAALAEQSTELEDRGISTRTEVFALFAVCGEIGAVVGPLLGAVLLGVGFPLACLLAAAVFAGILVAHARLLPRAPGAHRGEAIYRGWAEVLRNRRFLVFAAAYSTWLLSYNQLYLGLPVELRRATGGQDALGWLFALASIMIVFGQLPLAALARRRLGPARALGIGFGCMAAGFAALAVLAPLPPGSGPWALAPATALVVLLTLGQMLAVPVAQDLVPRLGGGTRLGAYFGFLSSAGGAAVLLGSTGAGHLLDLAARPQPGAGLPWLLLALLPAAGGVTLWWVSRRPGPM